MPTIAMSGADTISVNDRIFNDLADANCVELTFPNDIAALKTGKNGNSIYALNETGRQCELKMRLVRGSADDRFMNGLMANQQANFAGFILLKGEFTKKIGDGSGVPSIKNDTYILSGGVFTKQVPGKTNVEGDTEQSISEYMLKFSNAPRVIT